jgi:hypothetical protein
MTGDRRPMTSPVSGLPSPVLRLLSVAKPVEAWNKTSLLQLFIGNTGDETGAYYLFTG